MIRNKFYNNVKILILNISQLLVNVLINELMDTSNIAILLYNSWNIFQVALTFATNYSQSSLISQWLNSSSYS